MTVVRQAAICLALTLLLPGSVFAQVLSEQQLDYLRDQFLEAAAGTVDGSAINVGTLPTDRIQGLVPANKIIEADPRFFLWLDTNTYVQVESDPIFNTWLGTNTYIQTETDPIFNTWLGTNTYIQTETDPIFDSWLDTNTYIQTETDPVFDAWYNGTNGYTTNLVIPLVGQTITLYIANGLITNTLTEGP